MIRNTIVFFALAASSTMAPSSIAAAAPIAQDWPTTPAFSFQARESGRGDSDYQAGLRALDARLWDQAIASFEASAGHKGPTADAALYWKAYAQNRAGRADEALGTIAALRHSYRSSRWIRDARALEVEVRAKTGAPVSPGAEPDEDLKVMAINSLMQSDPDKAFPILEKLVKNSNSPKIQEKALFVLTQSPSPDAHKLLSDIARGSSNPDLQLKAIRYLGMMGNEDGRKQLASIYNSSSDDRVKHAILQGFMVSGSRDLLLNVAKTEKNPDLRREAIRQLAITGGQDELWQLYQSESSLENKQEILKSMFLTGNSSRLIEIEHSEKNPNLRIAAIKSLGLMGDNGRGDVLASIYQSDHNREVRDAVLNALFLQQNGKALVGLARSEKDPELKQEIVKKLALVHSKEATDYVMELLK
ncbi:MAG: HEAT repeat domain-containing protein [Bryobacteraceae bacterium]